RQWQGRFLERFGMCRLDVDHPLRLAARRADDSWMRLLFFHDGGVRCVGGFVEVARDAGFNLEAAVLVRFDRLSRAELQQAGPTLTPFLDLSDTRQQVA